MPLQEEARVTRAIRCGSAVLSVSMLAPLLSGCRSSSARTNRSSSHRIHHVSSGSTTIDTWLWLILILVAVAVVVLVVMRIRDK